MQATIINKQYIARGILQVDLKIQHQNPEFLAGQYLYLDLVDNQKTKDPGPKRYFSIISTPNNKEFISIATIIRESIFKQSLIQLPIGAQVEIGPIMGKFTLPSSFARPVVMIAGGIGITPYISMLRFIHEEKLPYQITLIYSGKTLESTAFLAELMAYQKSIPNFKLIQTFTSDPKYLGEKRRIGSDFLREYIAQPKEKLYYLSGSVAFVQAMIEALTTLQVDRAQIKTDNFSGY